MLVLRRANGEGNGTPLPYSCLENPMDRGAWWAAVHGVATSQIRLSDFTFTFHFHALEKEVATHSSVLAWRVPGTGEPGGLPSMGSHRVGHDWSDLAAAAAARRAKVEKLADLSPDSLPNSCFCSVTQLCPTLWPHGLQHARPPCPSPTPRACSNSCPSSQWCQPTILSFSPSALHPSQHQGLFQWAGYSYQVAKVLELQYQAFQWVSGVDFLWERLVWSPWYYVDLYRYYLV